MSVVSAVGVITNDHVGDNSNCLVGDNSNKKKPPVETGGG